MIRLSTLLAGKEAKRQWLSALFPSPILPRRGIIETDT